MSTIRRFALVFLAAIVFLPSPAAAQQKKALTQADWDKWKSISGAMLTSDGKWAGYSISPLVGDGEFVVHATNGNTEYRVPRGYLGRPNNVPGGLRPRAGGNPEDEPAGPQIAAGQFTHDSKYALVLTYPAQVEFDRVARDRRRAAAVQNRSDLAIVRLSDGNVTTVPRVRSFRLPRFSGAWVAYIAADSTADSAGARPSGQQGARPAAGPRRRFGTTLTLRNMGTGAEEKIADVMEYAFDDSARVLVYSVVSRADGKDGVFSRTLASGAVATLASGKGDYDQLTLDRVGAQVAFLTNKDEFGKEGATYALYVGA
ncbi:MAG TPA: hypothetical protein VF483_08355, partial [Gemmatimonadaceae bacterium]